MGNYGEHEAGQHQQSMSDDVDEVRPQEELSAQQNKAIEVSGHHPDFGHAGGVVGSGSPSSAMVGMAPREADKEEDE